MGLFTTLLTLPVSAPIHGAMWAARKINDLAHEQYDDPEFIRAELVALEGQLLAGEITEEEYEEVEIVLLTRLQEADAAQSDEAPLS